MLDALVRLADSTAGEPGGLSGLSELSTAAEAENTAIADLDADELVSRAMRGTTFGND
ncbi:hypothetical protein ACFQ10_09020 [Streptomyces indonesiensis]